MSGLSLYIHIPFCVRKCFYCDFLSFSAGNSEKAKYIKALVNELLLWKGITKKIHGTTSCTNTESFYFDTIFIGGGTPSCLEPSMLIKIVQALNSHISKDTEFTIEANPGTITENHIEAFKQAGINRISLGLQSAQDNELKNLGRIHTYDGFYNNFQKLRMAGFDNINIDIMSGIPGQTLESYRDTLYKVADLKPQHISAYSLIVEPGTVFYKMQEQNKLQIPDEDTDRDMYSMTKEILGRYGYNRYEISNYSIRGKECRHNITYWTGKDYLGVGLGASSYINGIRFAGTKDYNKYTRIFGDAAILEKRIISGNTDTLNQINLKPIRENIGDNYEKLSITAKMEEFMFLGLRLCKGISKSEFQKRFGTSIEKVYGDVISRHLQNNLLAEDINNDRIYLTSRGIDISNYVLSDFILTSI